MLTKANKKTINMILPGHKANGNDGAVARILSFMIRSSVRKTEQNELRQIARDYNVINHPEFLA